ncbi:MAG: hypothetical protein QXS85_02620 [Acidilobaceae archaeon]
MESPLSRDSSLKRLDECNSIYCVVSPTATTSPFKPRGYASSAGRIDIVARCMYVLSAFSGRVCFMGALLGPPSPPKLVLDTKPRYSSEREAAVELSRALKRGGSGSILVLEESIEKVLLEAKRLGFALTLLREDGVSVLENLSLIEGRRLFLLGSQVDIPEHIESYAISLGASVVSVGPVSLHTEHVIAFIEWLRETSRARGTRLD